MFADFVINSLSNWVTMRATQCDCAMTWLTNIYPFL